MSAYQSQVSMSGEKHPATEAGAWLNAGVSVSIPRLIAEASTPEKAGIIVLKAMADAEKCWETSGVILGRYGWLHTQPDLASQIEVFPSTTENAVTIRTAQPGHGSRCADVPATLFALVSAMVLTQEASTQDSAEQIDLDTDGIMAVIRASASLAVARAAHVVMATETGSSSPYAAPLRAYAPITHKQSLVTAGHAL